MEHTVITWLIRIFRTKAPDDHEVSAGVLNNNIIHGLKIKLTYTVYESYAATIIEQFFAIIIGKEIFYCDKRSKLFRARDRIAWRLMIFIYK